MTDTRYIAPITQKYIYQVVLYQVRDMIADVAREFEVEPSYVRTEIRAACNLTENES